MSSTKPTKSYSGFEEGSYASRKGRLCLIKKIHFEMHPPAVTVIMMDNNYEVGTEFDRLKPINAWYCTICTAKNTNINANKCSFCNINRKYNEKISIIEPNEQQPKNEPIETKIEELSLQSESESDTESEVHDTDNDNDNDSDNHIEPSPEYTIINDDSNEYTAISDGH
eukprot:347902_1